MSDPVITSNITPPDTPQQVPNFYDVRVATVADAEDLIRDENGFTYPNLHRRIQQEDPLPEGVLDVEYTLFTQGGYSYRATRYITHDEESTDSEIP